MSPELGITVVPGEILEIVISCLNGATVNVECKTGWSKGLEARDSRLVPSRLRAQSQYREIQLPHSLSICPTMTKPQTGATKTLHGEYASAKTP